MIPKILTSCTDSTLKLLKRMLEEHEGKIPTKTILRQILGDGFLEVYSWLQEKEKICNDTRCVNELLEVILLTRESYKNPEDLFDLIISGPDVSDVPICETLTTIHDLIHSAEKEILICDYAIYGAESIFQHIKLAFEKKPQLNVRMVLHVFEDGRGQIGRLERFSKDFLNRHWKADKLPELYVDPRNLINNPGNRTSMHAKCYIADHTKALITSANLTDMAHLGNIETGILVKYSGLVGRLVKYFDGLISEGYLKRVEFP